MTPVISMSFPSSVTVRYRVEPKAILLAWLMSSATSVSLDIARKGEEEVVRG